jgi:predicted GNAT family N-acyltransferase
MYQYIFKTWADGFHEAYPIRLQVFVHEQNIPIDLEIDEYDPTATHLIVFLNLKPIGTARIFNADENEESHLKIGRLALLEEHRHQGIGSKMMEILLDYAQIRNCKKISLNAQIDALAFYEKFGFKADEQVFDEGGILHRQCIKYLVNVK